MKASQPLKAPQKNRVGRLPFELGFWLIIPRFEYDHGEMNRMSLSESDYRIPLMIGVTGHRDIRSEDYDAICERVRVFFKGIQLKFPHTPLKVYCGLAAGADQLVAQVALENQLELVPVLPMPIDLYTQDFCSDPAARNVFEKLMKSCPKHIELPLVAGTTGEDISADTSRSGVHAKAQYAMLGNFLAVRCQLLLTLWDGVEATEVGGTGFTVDSKLKGRLEGDAALVDPIEGGLVYWIPVQRRSRPSLQDQRKEGYVPIGPKKALVDALHEIERYNAVPNKAIDSSNKLECAFAHADSLAILFQRQVRRLRNVTFGCVVTLVCSYGIYSEYDHRQIALIIYFLALVTGSLIWLFDRKRAVEQRFLDYRTLAEALRIQNMWTQNKVDRSVADYYLRKHRQGLRWIRFALRAFATTEAIIQLLHIRRTVVKGTDSDSGFPHGQAWMNDQHEYFKRTLRSRESNVNKLQLASKMLYALGLLAAFTALGIPFLEIVKMREHEIIFLMGALPALAGTLGAWVKQAALGEEALHARSMETLFSLALEEWARPESQCSRRAILEHLGKEALQENADWLALRRSRPLEAPLGAG